MENKTIEFVCTANNGRSTISRAIAQNYLVRHGLSQEYGSISSGSHADQVLAGNMPLGIKKMVLESGLRDGICTSEELAGLIGKYSLDEIEKRRNEDPTYKVSFDAAAERCRSHYSAIEEAECMEVAHELGIEQHLDGNFKQTRARGDVFAVMTMGNSNLKAVQEIYRSARHNPIMEIISKYVLGSETAEVPNAFSKGKDAYLTVVDQLRELVPQAIEKAVNEIEKRKTQ
jgi:protein-tyrosine-phosphatase